MHQNSRKESAQIQPQLRIRILSQQGTGTPLKSSRSVNKKILGKNKGKLSEELHGGQFYTSRGGAGVEMVVGEGTVGRLNSSRILFAQRKSNHACGFKGQQQQDPAFKNIRTQKYLQFYQQRHQNIPKTAHPRKQPTTHLPQQCHRIKTAPKPNTRKLTKNNFNEHTTHQNSQHQPQLQSKSQQHQHTPKSSRHSFIAVTPSAPRTSRSLKKYSHSNNYYGDADGNCYSNVEKQRTEDASPFNRVINTNLGKSRKVSNRKMHLNPKIRGDLWINGFEDIFFSGTNHGRKNLEKKNSPKDCDNQQFCKPKTSPRPRKLGVNPSQKKFKDQNPMNLQTNSRTQNKDMIISTTNTSSQLSNPSQIPDTSPKTNSHLNPHSYPIRTNSQHIDPLNNSGPLWNNNNNNSQNLQIFVEGASQRDMSRDLEFTFGVRDVCASQWDCYRTGHFQNFCQDGHRDREQEESQRVDIMFRKNGRSQQYSFNLNQQLQH